MSFIIENLGNNQRSTNIETKAVCIHPRVDENDKFQHVSSCSGLKKGLPSRYDRPSSIQQTIANAPPASTDEIVRKTITF